MAIDPLSPRPLLDFDVQGAYYFLTDQGLSNPDAAQTIAKKLAQTANFDAEAAFKAGFTSEQVISKLTGIEERPGKAFATELGKGVIRGYPAAKLGAMGLRAGAALGASVGAVAGAIIGGGAGLLGGSFLGLLLGDPVAKAALGDKQYLPSDLPLARAGETMGYFAGAAGPTRAMFSRIPGVAASARGAPGAVARLDQTYVDFGAKRLLNNASNMRARAARMEQAALQRAQTATLNPRTGTFEVTRGAGRIPELATRGAAAATRGAATIPSGAARVLGGAEEVAVGVGRAARDRGRWYATQAAITPLAGAGAAIAEQIDPGDPITRIAFELGATLGSPTKIFAPAVAKVYGAGRHPVATAKAVGDWGNTKRSRMARDYVNEQLSAARQRDPSLETPVELAEAIETALRTRPEAPLLSVGQMTGHPMQVLLEAQLASTNPTLRRDLQKSAEAGLKKLYETMQGLKEGASVPMLALAIETERGLQDHMLRGLIETELARSSQLADKMTAQYTPKTEYAAGTLIYEGADRALKTARKVEKYYYSLVEPKMEVIPTNLIAAWDGLFDPVTGRLDEFSPIPQQIKGNIKKLGGRIPGDEAPVEAGADLLTYRTPPRAEGIIGDRAPARPRVRRARQILSGRVTPVFQRDRELKIAFGDEGRQIPVAYKAPAGVTTSDDIEGWDKVAELLVQENYMTQAQFTQGDANRTPVQIAKDILAENPVHPADQQRWTDFQDATRAFADRAIERGGLGAELAEVAEVSAPAPTTVGELMKLRRILGVASRAAGTGVEPFFDYAVYNKLQSALLDDLGANNKVRALVNDPWLNSVVGEEVANADRTSAIRTLEEAGVTENEFNLARAYTFSRLLQDTFHRSFVGDKLLKRRGQGDPRQAPETALRRLFAGPVTLQLEQLQDAMEFLQPRGLIERRGFTLPPERGFLEEEMVGEILPSDPAALDVEFLERVTPGIEPLEEGMAGLNGAVRGFLQHGINKNVLTTKEAQVLPGYEAAPAIDVAARPPSIEAVASINRPAYDKFLEEYTDILDLPAFSGLRDDLTNLDTAVVTLERALSNQSTLAKNAAKEVTLARALGVENPGIVFGSAINSQNPERSLNNVIRTINQISRVQPSVEKDLRTAWRNAALDWAYLGAGGANNFDWPKFYDLLYRTKDVVKTFDQTKSKNVMAILRDGNIVSKGFEQNLKNLIGRAEVIQNAAMPGGMGIENVVGSDGYKMFAIRFAGAQAGARIQRMMPGGVGSIQIPGFGAQLATELLDRTPKSAFIDILAGLAEPGEAQRFADFLREGATESQQVRGLQRFFRYIGEVVLASPAFGVAAIQLMEPQEEYEPAPPLPVEVAELPDIQPTMASPSMQQAAAPPGPPPAPPMPSPQGQPVPQPPPGEGVTPERSQYAAYFPNDPISGLIRQQEQQGIAALMQQQQMQGQV